MREHRRLSGTLSGEGRGRYVCHRLTTTTTTITTTTTTTITTITTSITYNFISTQV
ncbi:hypothetical protein E2C01_097086 [Portunus trituberculatus]|uniref:Uncharacterized protein n=1 Tax=Portunus trituberculatus TaxID=210409 RepID=A0A5B7JU92_PORTR|nr:hypothetical protein [Portunus trituberculatus]